MKSLIKNKWFIKLKEKLSDYYIKYDDDQTIIIIRAL